METEGSSVLFEHRELKRGEESLVLHVMHCDEVPVALFCDV